MKYLIHMAIWCLALIVYCGSCSYSQYKFSKDFKGDWDIAEKASTIDMKSQYMQKFYLNILQNSRKFADNSAVFFQTPTEDFDNNLKALKSLTERLIHIEKMDEKSFAYQMAIQQITGQEQGEARDMLSIFGQCYVKNISILFAKSAQDLMVIILGLWAVGLFVYFLYKEDY